MHPTASHTGSLVPPLDPGARATQLGGFMFGHWDPPDNTIQVRAGKSGKNTITWELMGKIL